MFSGVLREYDDVLHLYYVGLETNRQNIQNNDIDGALKRCGRVAKDKWHRSKLINDAMIGALTPI